MKRAAVFILSFFLFVDLANAAIMGNGYVVTSAATGLTGGQATGGPYAAQSLSADYPAGQAAGSGYSVAGGAFPPIPSVASSTPSAGHGGGGGGVITPVDTTMVASVSRIWGPVSSGTTMSAAFHTANLSVTNVSMHFLAQVRSIEITVRSFGQYQPKNTTSFSGVIYQYVQILHPELVGKADQTSFTFSIPTTWLTQQGIAAANIRVYRYEQGVWKEYTPRILSTSGDSTTFLSEVPGFSYFALGVRGASPAQTTPNTPLQQEPQPPTEQTPPSTVVDTPPMQPTDSVDAGDAPLQDVSSQEERLYSTERPSLISGPNTLWWIIGLVLLAGLIAGIVLSRHHANTIAENPALFQPTAGQQPINRQPMPQTASPPEPMAQDTLSIHMRAAAAKSLTVKGLASNDLANTDLPTQDLASSRAVDYPMQSQVPMSGPAADALENLRTFIASVRSKGCAIQDIRTHLLSVGWDHALVEDELAASNAVQTYIATMRSRKFSDALIRQRLVDGGWERILVDAELSR